VGYGYNRLCSEMKDRVHLVRHHSTLNCMKIFKLALHHVDAPDGSTAKEFGLRVSVKNERHNMGPELQKILCEARSNNARCARHQHSAP
jgi:hypothetical protein